MSCSWLSSAWGLGLSCQQDRVSGLGWGRGRDGKGIKNALGTSLDPCGHIISSIASYVAPTSQMGGLARNTGYRACKEDATGRLRAWLLPPVAIQGKAVASGPWEELGGVRSPVEKARQVSSTQGF